MASLKMVNTPLTLACVADALNLLLFIYKWFRRCVGRLQRRPDSIQSQELRNRAITRRMKWYSSCARLWDSMGVAKTTVFAYNNFAIFARLRRKKVSRFTVNINTQQENFISLSKPGYGPLEFNFWRACLHLTQKVGRNNCDVDW